MLRSVHRAASAYDAAADVQREAAAELARLLPESAPQRVLEIGCGTGLFTALLQQRYPDAGITAIDPVAPMLAVAQQRVPRAQFCCLRAEQIDPAVRYPLIVSASTLHWCPNLPSVLRRIAGCLEPGGELLASLFGPLTYEELNASWNEVLPGQTAVPARSFPDHAQLEGLLHAVFPEITVTERRYRRDYASLRELLRSIRDTGTRGPLREGGLLTPRRLQRIEDHYRLRHDGITATYQVFFCRGRA